MTHSTNVDGSMTRPSFGNQARIALINMPFARTSSPSIQCGLLKAELLRAGHVAKVYYLNMELAFEMGPAIYTKISQSRQANSLLGEWLFSGAAFGYSPNEAEYFAAFPELRKTFSDDELASLQTLRSEVLPEFIERWATKVDWSTYHAVGFTSTFAQNNAAFALAQRIKARHPQVATIFGGANFHGDMGREFLRKLPFMDYVVDGEGEAALIALADRLSIGTPAIGIRGVSVRTGDTIIDGGRAEKVSKLDALAEPDYDEYFDAMWTFGKEKVVGDQRNWLLLETARGCWWGEKHHCTFCGLNGDDMGFRSKTAAKVLEEMSALTNRYQMLDVEVVDNIIDAKYVESVCKPLVQQRCDYKIFWEVKANLTAAQLRTMANAGIVHMQPGIESLSTNVLKLMRKGINMLKNVRFLKWANYFGIAFSWHILTGFPGETEEDYQKQYRLIPLLKHLPPPTGWGRIWLERYSPYFFDPSFPVHDVRPGMVYKYLYPSGDIDLKEVAYFFEYSMGDTIPMTCLQGLFDQLEAWKAAWQKDRLPALAFRRGPGWMEVLDQREEKARHHWFYGPEALAYEACCETDRPPEAVWRSLREKDGPKPELSEVKAALERACELGIMIEEDGHFLSLAQPVNRNWSLDQAAATAARAGTPAPTLRVVNPAISAIAH